MWIIGVVKISKIEVMKDAAKAMAGRLGGIARERLYGNPGTKEGRRLGGLRSIAAHQKINGAFKTLRAIKEPKESQQLAELMGILAGDGHIDTYQVYVTTSAETDYEHARYVQSMLKSIFKLPVLLRKRKDSNAVIVRLSSKNACDLLRTIGMSTTNKTRDQIQPPTWIYKNVKFKHAFLRGLIDTDGCVYWDRHKSNGRDYASLCIAFTNASIPLLNFVTETWKELGYNPSRFGRHVRLRRRKQVLNYSERIGFSNPKHAQKFAV